jgi:hypothetical protein
MPGTGVSVTGPITPLLHVDIVIRKRYATSRMTDAVHPPPPMHYRPFEGIFDPKGNFPHSARELTPRGNRNTGCSSSRQTFLERVR